ncbi:uncharacterized protein Smp_203620 [Schistosoma mansoni]|uniref:uncharacterized protein n=1 Tax=Schistosoma mansoni TaxID=6183 RepID=UPI00022DCC03|nr:uncharacterized protein Smp_203620 [Schistosoma mansoni]|eukprot:XP_018654725.1 uncharacterized protein Smp_203620 [Schistosoma mansoni]
MALTSDQFQLLIQRQEQRFRKSQLDFIDKLHAKLLNHPCFGSETEVDALISKLRTELENDYRTNEYAGESLNESIQSNNLSAAVIHDQPSNPVLPVSETCPVHGPSLINPETKRASNESSSSQRDNILLSAIKIAAVPAHEETENKSSSVLNTEAPNEINHDTKNVSNESNDQNSLIVLPDPDYFADSYVPVEFSYKNGRKMSDVLNDNQESNTTLIDTDYPNDSLSTNEVPRKFKETISEESNVGDLESNVVDPHDLFSSNAFPVKCDKHIALIVTWLYEDPTVFRGGG